MIFLTDPVQLTGLSSGSWQTKDISAIVPAGATGVILHVHMNDTGTTCQFRMHDSSDNYVTNAGTMVYRRYISFVGLNAGREFDYYIGSTNVLIWVVAYTTTDGGYFSLAQEVTVTGTGWQTYTAPVGVPAGAKAVLVNVQNTTAAGLQLGTRATDYAGNIITNTSGGHTHFWHIVPLNGSNQFDVYVPNSTTYGKIYVMGYLTSGNFTSSYGSINTGVAGSYVDYDVTAWRTPRPLTTGVLVQSYGAAYNYNVNVRRHNSSVTTPYTNAYGDYYQSQFAVALGSDNIFEYQVSNTGQDFLLLGFFEEAIPAFDMVLTGESFPPGTISAEPLAGTASISGPELKIKVDFTSAPLSATSSGETARIQRINQTPFSSNTSISASQATDVVTAVSLPHFNNYDDTDEATPFTIDATFDESNLKGDVSFPTFEVDSDLLAGSLFDVEVSLPKFSVSSGFPDSFFDVDISVPRFTVDSELVPLEFNADVSFPTLSVSSELVPQNDFTVAVSLPSAFVSSFLDGSASAQTHKAVVMNISNHAVTEYPNYGFNSFCTFNEVALGAITGSGIYVLSGNKDVAKRIDAEVVTGMVDTHKDVVRKQIEAWLTGRTKGELKLTVHLNEGVLYDYPFDRIRHKIDELRAKVGKGIKQRFAEFGVKNVAGSDFDIDSLRIDGEPVPRKTR